MLNELYRDKFYLHANKIEEVIEEKDTITIESHPITWEIAITIKSIYNDYMSFTKITNIVKSFIAPYQMKLIDEMEPFNEIKPNIRAFCHFLKANLDVEFAKIGCVVLCYEIAETPSKSYIYDNMGNIEYYKYKTYLSASHSILINNKQGQEHTHSFELNVLMTPLKPDFKDFESIESKVENMIQKYQNQSLNSMIEFTNINPTLENITIYFREEFKKQLEAINCKLTSIEIAETPSISYILN
jgi:6-pyruvoyl tetrahydropterin synthase-like protein